MRLEKSLESHQALFNLLRRVPVCVLFRTSVGPTLQKLLHGVDTLSRLIVRDVDDIIQEKLWDEAKQFG